MRASARLALALVLALAAASGLAAAAGVAEKNEPGLRHDPFAWPAATRAPVVAAPAIAASAAEPPPKAWQPRLRAVVVAGNRSMVSVEGSIIFLGEQIDGFRLVQVEERSATFSKNGVRVEVKMDGGNAAAR